MINMCTYKTLFNKKCVNSLVRRAFSKNPLIHVSEEVRNALHFGQPVVALESTIVTHGMPFPKNIECAKEVEDIVRKQGAIPATIAIINGSIKVGLTDSELEEIGNIEISKPIKTSRRDLAYVVSNKLNGGTTVSGTIIVAKTAGISIFATGGIGGVHRGAEETFDISTDLLELGKSNIALVSSGVKSILDIPKTLEYLETQGVFVATFGESNNFPAFYSRESSCKAPYVVNDFEEAARIIKTSNELNLNSAMLFAVPVPKEYSLKTEEIDAVINKALHLAKTKYNITGKEITPFLLSQVAKLTQGKSLDTNIALIKNNAKVAALISVALANLDEKEEETSVKSGSNEKPVIIGGSNLDCNAVLNTSEIKLDGRIHLGKFTYEAGGVARNLCESLYKLGFPSNFLTVLGDDVHGERLKNTIPQECQNIVSMLPGQNTAQCVVVFEDNKDCRFLMGDMEIHQSISPKMIKKYENVLRKAPLIILDGNVPIKTMETVLEIAENNSIPVFYEPTDVEISVKPFQTTYRHAVKFITPNYVELKYIASYFKINIEECPDKLLHAAKLAKMMVNYVDNIIVTMGSEGVIIARRGEASDPFLTKTTEEILVRHYPVKIVKDIVNVSGAGDSLASGIISGILSNKREDICISIGTEAAKTALLSRSAVAEKMFDMGEECWRIPASYINL